MAVPSPAPPQPSTLDKPRILCLHGGGTNASILEVQARSYIPKLAPYFRLVFPEAPFLCAPHPAVIPVYEDFGPFRMWSRWSKEQPVCGGDPDCENENVLSEWDYQMRSAMEADDAQGATGEWVGLLGFSQGAKVAASLLFEQQLRLEDKGVHAVDGVWSKEALASDALPAGFAGGKWRFAVLLAGRGPFVSLSPLGDKVAGLEGPGKLPNMMAKRTEPAEKKLSLPTVHVHGRQDPQVSFHRLLWELDCEKSSSTRIEWDGTHRLAHKNEDVEPVVKAILKMAQVSFVIVREGFLCLYC